MIVKFTSKYRILQQKRFYRSITLQYPANLGFITAQMEYSKYVLTYLDSSHIEIMHLKMHNLDMATIQSVQFALW